MSKIDHRWLKVTVFSLSALLISSFALAAPHGPSAENDDAKTALVVPTQVKRLVFARGVEARKPAAIANSFEADGNRIYGYVELDNKAAAKKIAMVWQGEKRSFRYTLDVGKSPTWRTWSMIRASKANRGEWTLSIVDLESNKTIAQRELLIR